MKLLFLVSVCILFSACFINYVGKGYEAYIRGDLENSEKYFRTAVRKKPRDPIAHNNLAAILLDLERPDEAIQYLKLATILSKTPYASPHINLARAYFEKGQLDMAKKESENAVSIDRNNPVALLGLANVYCLLNENLDIAKTYLTEVTKSEKISDLDRAIAWSTLAETEYKLNNIESAVNAIDTALSYDTDNNFYRQQKALYRP